MGSSVESIPPRSTAGSERFIAAVSHPLDRARQAMWSLTAKTRWGRQSIRDRSLRLTVLAVGHMFVAFALTLLAPVWLLLLGPLLLGVPHVASDIRYLLIKPPLPIRRLGLWLILGPLLMMTLLRIVATLGGPFSSEVEIMLGASAMLGGLAIAKARRVTRLVAGGAIVALAIWATTQAHFSLVTIAHLHNLVAFGLWLYFLRGEVKGARLVAIVATYLALGALLISPAFDDLYFGHVLSGDVGHFSLDEMAWSLAPGAEIEPALRWVMLYAFLQSMHYVVWLRLIPQRLDERPAPPTFKRSLSRVRSDFGRIGFIVLVLATVSVPLLAVLTDAAETRHVYLLAAISHGWIELAIVAALLVHRTQPADHVDHARKSTNE
jgi:hypothetical protein